MKVQTTRFEIECNVHRQLTKEERYVSRRSSSNRVVLLFSTRSAFSFNRTIMTTEQIFMC